MKLRSLLLTAALFVSAGIASAAVVHDTANGADAYYWKKDGSVNAANQVTVTLTKPEAESWDYYLYSLSNPSWEVELAKGTNKVTLDAASTQYGVRAYKSNGGGSAEKKICFSGVNSPIQSGGFNFIGNAASNQIVFGKGNDVKGVVSFGSPLPAPVVTLLIALGFGAALVMYRNRKVKA